MDGRFANTAAESQSTGTGTAIMRPGGGKAKGAAFERHICVALSHWMTKGRRDDLFWRSAMSGGRATVRKKNQTQVGDISAIDPIGDRYTKLFVTECKFIKDANFDAWLLEGKGNAYNFWSQLIRIAGKRHPMLIIKQNRSDVMALTTWDGWLQLGSASTRAHCLHHHYRAAYMIKFKLWMEYECPL